MKASAEHFCSDWAWTSDRWPGHAWQLKLLDIQGVRASGGLSSVNKTSVFVDSTCELIISYFFHFVSLLVGSRTSSHSSRIYWCISCLKYRQKFLLLLSLMACWYVETQATILVFGFKQVEATTSLLNHQLLISTHAGTITEYHYLLKPLCIIFSFTIQSSSTLLHSIKWL